MIKTHHIGIYCRDLEGMRAFYEKYFGAVCGEKYTNRAKGFESYFLKFGEGCSLEIMRKESVTETNTQPALGLTHFAFSMGSAKAVDELTERLRADGYVILSEPRTTGDGFYESTAADPEGNHIEITG